MKVITLATALVASTCVSALATPAQAELRQFNIPSGSLKAALDTFGRQAGRPIIYKAEEVRDIASAGYRGSETPERALASGALDRGCPTRKAKPQAAETYAMRAFCLSYVDLPKARAALREALENCTTVKARKKNAMARLGPCH